ncbi:MAG: J domain-containing protein [Acidobacteria bacterium]|nr:J domain-containing protein [Acidobacteriota bacterium]
MPSKQADHYETLGIGREASTDDVRKAYRRLARKFHPDLNPGDKASEDKFKKLQEAYDVLSDDKKRKMYDQFGFYSEQGFPPAGARPNAPGGFGFGGFDFSDIFGQEGPAGGAHRGAGPRPEGDGGFRDLFSNFFKNRQSHTRSAERGSDLEYALNIDFWQSIRGTQVRLTINRQETCHSCAGSGSSGGGSSTCAQCNGTGNVNQMAGAMRFSLTCPRCGGTGKLSSVCASCHGEGRITQPEAVEIRIPPGTRTGSRLRVAAKGSAGLMGGADGDLYITVRVDDHPFFHRDGDDIIIKVPITVTEASLGAKIEVPTIDGRSVLKIPMGTHNGQRFRLREKGVLNARTNTRGDQLIEVELTAPKAQDERTRELLRELAALHPDDPRADIWKQV